MVMTRSGKEAKRLSFEPPKTPRRSRKKLEPEELEEIRQVENSIIAQVMNDRAESEEISSKEASPRGRVETEPQQLSEEFCEAMGGEEEAGEAAKDREGEEEEEQAAEDEEDQDQEEDQEEDDQEEEDQEQEDQYQEEDQEEEEEEAEAENDDEGDQGEVEEGQQEDEEDEETRVAEVLADEFVAMQEEDSEDEEKSVEPEEVRAPSQRTLDIASNLKKVFETRLEAYRQVCSLQLPMFELKSELQSTPLYIQQNEGRFRFNEELLSKDTDKRSDASGISKILSKSVLTSNFEAGAVPHIGRKDRMKEAKKSIPKTAGKKWFGMGAPEITPEIKRDLQILNMRNYIDPKRHYKKSNPKEMPKFFQIGRVIEGNTDFFTSRLTKKERKETIVDELLHDVKTKTYLKKKFTEINQEKQNKFEKKRKPKGNHHGRDQKKLKGQ